jgi:type IV pilus assembly protein PilM
MAKAKIGFDVGPSSLKIAVERRGGVDLHEVRLPKQMVENGEVMMPNAFSQFLKQTKKELYLPNGDGVLVLPPSQVIFRLVTVPRMTERQLLMNLPYEFDDFISGGPEQYYYDYAVCEDPQGREEPEELTIMAAAAAKDVVYSYIRMFADAGIRLKIILPQEIAMIRLAQNYRAHDSKAPAKMCFVDLGHSSTRVIVVKDDRVQAARTLNLAMRDLDEIIADQYNVDAFLADTFKRENYKDVLGHPRCVEFYRQLAVEILKVINFYQFSFREEAELTGVYLLGGGANIAPLRETVADMLSIPIRSTADLLPGGDGMVTETSYSGILAAGAVLAGEER